MHVRTNERPCADKLTCARTIWEEDRRQIVDVADTLLATKFHLRQPSSTKFDQLASGALLGGLATHFGQK